MSLKALRWEWLAIWTTSGVMAALVFTAIVFQGVASHGAVIAPPDSRPISSETERTQQHPFVQLNIGGHTATVRDIAFTPDGKSLVSGSWDKTIRVWNLETRSSRVIRGQIGDGEMGQINAIALSPKGDLIAAGGVMGESCPDCGDIRLIDFSGGQITGLLHGHNDNMLALAFSPSGQWLASANYDGTVRVWDVQRKIEATRAIRYDARKVAFHPDERYLLAVGADASVEVLNWPAGNVARSFTGQAVLKAVAVSQDGAHVAAADQNGMLYIWGWSNGSLERRIATADGFINAIAFGAGPSKTYVVTGSTRAPFSRVWDVTTGEEVPSYQNRSQIVPAVAFSPDGSLLATAGGNDHSIHVMPANGRTDVSPFVLGMGSTTPYEVAFVTAKSDGGGVDRYVGWGNQDPCPTKPSCPATRGRVDYAFRLPSDEKPGLERPRGISELSAAPVVEYARLLAAGKQIVREASRNDPDRFPRLYVATPQERILITDRDIARGEDHLSYSFDPRGDWIASGGRNGMLEAFYADGRFKGEFRGHVGDVWSVAVAPSGPLLVSAASDQTINMWNADTGELIASLLMLSLGEWIIWTPQGYYASSTYGDRLIGWQINNGPDKTPFFTTAREVSKKFHQPKLIERALILASAEEAIREQADLPQIDLAGVVNKQLPKIEILRPQDGATLSESEVDLAFDLKDEFKQVRMLRVYANQADITPATMKGFAVVPAEVGGARKTVKVKLENGANKLLIRAMTDDGIVERSLTLFSTKPIQDIRRGKLYIVAVGVDQYPNLTTECGGASCKLNYAGADAQAFAKTALKYMGPMHREVAKVQLLFNGASAYAVDDQTVYAEPTKANIITALESLRNTDQNATSVVFLSGHGKISKRTRERYQFLATDATPAGDGDLRTNTVVTWADLGSALSDASGRKFLFLDTCHAAGAYASEIIKDMADDGSVISFSAVDKDSPAKEQDGLKQGVFTHVVLRGLSGEGSVKREVRLLNFSMFLWENVRELTGNTQTPAYWLPGDNLTLVDLNLVSR